VLPVEISAFMPIFAALSVVLLYFHPREVEGISDFDLHYAYPFHQLPKG
jgi:hypothetical protein